MISKTTHEVRTVTTFTCTECGHNEENVLVRELADGARFHWGLTPSAQLPKGWRWVSIADEHKLLCPKHEVVITERPIELPE